MRKLKVMCIYAQPADPITDAEGFLRRDNETHRLLPVTDHALGEDFIIAHEDYSHLDIRREFPYDPDYVSKLD